MTIRILLVDDSAPYRAQIRVQLDREDGLRVVAEAGDGRAALAQVDAQSPDIVLMDVSMPVMDGIEATRRLRAQHPAVPVLALSWHADGQFFKAMTDAGARGYVLKDDPFSELVAAIHAVAEGRGWSSPGLPQPASEGDAP
jgi:DNA-binding NarL/FixJ family response regulator